MSGTGLAKAAAFVLLHNVFAFFMDVVALARAVIRDVTLALPRFTLDGLDFGPVICQATTIPYTNTDYLEK
jgi:hypothetical protein